MSAALEPTEIQVHTPEVAFTCLTQGEGPLVLLVHGFPDIPQTWSSQIQALSAAGYRVIAPYLPGYLPSRAADNACFDKASLVNHLASLIEAISPGEKLHYIAQDWGAIIGYALSAARPDLLHSAVLMAVQKMKELGYRRIGLVVPEDQDCRLGGNFIGGFAAAQKLRSALEARATNTEMVKGRVPAPGGYRRPPGE